jgi:uncharacterized membrane protein required for colicin V production
MPFDLFCAGVFLLFAVLGLFRGLVRQLFGLAGFIGGIVLARTFAQPFGDAFAKDLGLPVSIAVATLAVAIFLAVEIAARIIGHLLHGALGTITGTVDKLGGLVVGAAKGLLVAWALASLIVLVRPHLTTVERETPVARLDLAHSQAIAAAASVNLISELRRPEPKRTSGARAR